MFFSRWTIYQGIIVVAFIVLGFISELFTSSIAISAQAPTISSIRPAFLIVLFVSIVSGLFSLIMYFQTKKSETFLKHPLWENMHILTFFLFILSVIGFIVLFLVEPLNAILLTNRWFVYLLIYYFICLLNLFILAIIHKVKGHAIKATSKLKQAWIWTIIITFFSMFML